jgi:Uma2 family endonuclease
MPMTTVTQTQSAPAPRTKWTTADLALLPDNGRRYEIIDGDLVMSRQPNWHHQHTADRICAQLNEWSDESGRGIAFTAPGVIFGDVDNIIPDVVWISNDRLSKLMDDAGHLTGAPELVVEVLSYGAQNEDRDRKLKLKLYESRGVLEYWIADWRLKQIEVYRRDAGLLKFVSVFLPQDTLTSPLLPGFACEVKRLFPKTE